MMNRDQLAELLGRMKVEDIAREAKLSTKTIYRLRNKKNAPTLDTVLAILEATKRLSKRKKVSA